MKVLFDTNVIIDIWKQDEFFLDSYAAYDVCIANRWEPHIAVTAIPDLEYLLKARHILSKDEVEGAMSSIFEMFTVIDAAECDCVLAHKSEMPDLEDGIIAFSAARNGMDAIVTRNEKDFYASPVPAITPRDFVSHYKPKNVNYRLLD